LLPEALSAREDLIDLCTKEFEILSLSRLRKPFRIKIGALIAIALFYIAMVGGPIAGALLAIALKQGRAWQVLLCAYLGGVVGTEAFRIWHTARMQALVASGQDTFFASGPSPGLAQRLVADLVPAIVVGGIVLGTHWWLGRR